MHPERPQCVDMCAVDQADGDTPSCYCDSGCCVWRFKQYLGEATVKKRYLLSRLRGVKVNNHFRKTSIHTTAGSCFYSANQMTLSFCLTLKTILLFTGSSRKTYMWLLSENDKTILSDISRRNSPDQGRYTDIIERVKILGVSVVYDLSSTSLAVLLRKKKNTVKKHD